MNIFYQLLPAITLLFGFLSGSVTEFWRDKRTANREIVARKEMRRESLVSRRNEFQHQTLLDLQEAIVDLARMTGSSNYQDEMAFRKTGKWQKQLLSAEINEGFRLAQAKMGLLLVRVRDQAVREQSEHFKTICVRVVLASNDVDAFQTLTMISPALEKLNQQIGEVLRTIDDEQ